MTNIRRTTAERLTHGWNTIPHVTQFDEADVTDLEAFRVTLNRENEKAGVKLTMLAFLIKASVAALGKFPDFNASLDVSGENLIHKSYFNIGFAADTPNGLVVPVVKGADGKGVMQIAKEMGELSAKAREGKTADLTKLLGKGQTWTVAGTAADPIAYSAGTAIQRPFATTGNRLLSAARTTDSAMPDSTRRDGSTTIDSAASDSVMECASVNAVTTFATSMNAWRNDSPGRHARRSRTSTAGSSSDSRNRM